MVMVFMLIALALLLWRIGVDIYLIIKNREWESPEDDLRPVVRR